MSLELFGFPRYHKAIYELQSIIPQSRLHIWQIRMEHLWRPFHLSMMLAFLWLKELLEMHDRLHFPCYTIFQWNKVLFSAQLGINLGILLFNWNYLRKSLSRSRLLDRFTVLKEEPSHFMLRKSSLVCHWVVWWLICSASLRYFSFLMTFERFLIFLVTKDRCK